METDTIRSVIGPYRLCWHDTVAWPTQSCHHNENSSRKDGDKRMSTTRYTWYSGGMGNSKESRDQQKEDTDKGLKSAHRK